jgi:uncharacterized sulfatase
VAEEIVTFLAVSSFKSIFHPKGIKARVNELRGVVEVKSMVNKGSDYVERRPNILFIMADEQRFDALGSVNPVVQTPHLDRLAEDSIVFNRAYTTNPSCVPARAAMFTGRYPSQCGAPTFITYVNDDETTFMSLLQANGYHTAVIGKQHFGNTGITKGYDYEDIIDLHSPADIDKVNEHSPSYLKYLAEAGFTDKEQLFSRVTTYTRKWKADIKYHVDHYIGEQGKQWLTEGRPANQPWFLCLSFPGPHQPFDCLGTPQAERYSLEHIDMPVTTMQDLEQKPAYYRAKIDERGILSQEEVRLMRLAYYANMSLIDDKVGEVLDTLKAIGEYDHTLIVYTSDHGDFQGDFGLAYKGQYLSEVLMRVPLLMKPPIVGFQGYAEQSFAANFDIAATCLGAARIPVPSDMSCKDLSGYWLPENRQEARAYMYTEASDVRAIRDDKWKMIHYRKRPYGELYDLENDPWERLNLWDDPSVMEVKTRLYASMMDELIKLGQKSNATWSENAPQI